VIDAPAERVRGLLSIVIPVFNEEDNLIELRTRLVRVLEGLGRPFEVVFVDDGSRDKSLALLTEFVSEDSRLRVVEFNRNYGQHAAVFAGFAQARGEVIVTLDADLQNPPEEIPKLLAKIDEDYDVVGGNRADRRDPLFRRIGSWFINRMTTRSTGIRMKDYGCMLRAYTRDVVDAMLQCREISTFIPVLATMFAKKVADVDVAHAERFAGRTKYSVLKLVKLQFDLTTAFSLWPLRLVTVVGFLLAIAGLTASATLLALRLLMGDEYALEGIFTLFAVLFFFVGVQFMAIGVLGEYIGRIYSEVRARPRYVVRRLHRKV
jgi:undecaprenyl-phosphate 4-deoxy-4-formamido-L-arabinose transferase